MVLLSGIVLDGEAPQPKFPVSQTIESFLKDPVSTLVAEGLTSDDFKKNTLRAEHIRIALSNLAEGCANLGITKPEYYEEAKDCIATTLAVALDSQLSPYHESVEYVTTFGNNGLYLTHLNIVLGSWKRLTNDDSYQSLNRRISAHLAKKTCEDPERNILSYPTLEYKWPADQTAALYSIWLFDQNYGTTISKEPVKEWVAYMDQRKTEKRTGLYVSEVTGNYPEAENPRGCALSWSIRYMATFAPEKAVQQWERYKLHFKQDYYTFAGFREWQQGYDSFQDADSGPIILGNGVAATAFAIGASNVLGDEKTSVQLERTEATSRLAIFLFGNQELKTMTNSFLARAIEFNIHTMERQ
jgi:hypothetical protein